MPDELRKTKPKYNNYQLFKTSWKYQTREFFENSTLHGVRFIAEKGRPAYEKLMWFCFVTIGAIVTLVIIVSLWEKFQTNPTITGLDTDFHNWDVPFPGVTICPTNPINTTLAEEFITKKWGSRDVLNDERWDFYEAYINLIANFSYHNFREIIKYQSDDTIPRGDFRELLFQVVLQCNDLFMDCEWKGSPTECCERFLPTFTEHGFCYSFNTLNAEKDWPGKPANIKMDNRETELIYETDTKWTIAFDADNITGYNNAYEIFIHNFEELPYLEMPPQHVWTQSITKIQFAARMTYTTNDTRQLSAKQRKCIFKDEVKLETSAEYSYWACVSNCRMKYAMKVCGCVPFFYHKVPGFPFCKIDGLVCLSKHLDELLLGLSCPCELGCDNTVYEVEKLLDAQAGDEGPVDIGFVSWPMIRYKREVLFGWVDLLVSFGGIAGLFLGFSLLSGVEIVYYFTMRAACMVYRDKEKLTEIRAEDVDRNRSDIDLSLHPHFPNKNKINAKDTPNGMFINNVIAGQTKIKINKRITKRDISHVPFLN